jgi:hypothetical protein
MRESGEIAHDHSPWQGPRFAVRVRSRDADVEQGRRGRRAASRRRHGGGRPAVVGAVARVRCRVRPASHGNHGVLRVLDAIIFGNLPRGGEDMRLGTMWLVMVVA